ncbi:MAG: SagB/ThcOx family dehydrogenase [Actinomycetota bacterium]
MRQKHQMWIAILLICLFCCSCRAKPEEKITERRISKRIALEDAVVKLPEPKRNGEMSLEKALGSRECKRSFTEQDLTLKQISQLLWAAQGRALDAITGATRTAPSAGALQPLELYVVSKDGVYHYGLEKHTLKKIKKGDRHSELADAALGQSPIAEAPINIVITAVYSRTAAKYGERATRYVHMEAGHAAQNILLEAVAMGLGGTPIGAFHDDQVQKVLSLPRNHEPLYIIPLGHPPQ